MLVEIKAQGDESQLLGLALGYSANTALLSKFAGQFGRRRVGHGCGDQPLRLAYDFQRVPKANVIVIQPPQQRATKSPAGPRPALVDCAATGKFPARKCERRPVCRKRFQAERSDSVHLFRLEYAMRMQKTQTTNAAALAKLGRRFFIRIHDLMLWTIGCRCNIWRCA